MVAATFSNQRRHGAAMSAIALTLGVPAFAGTTKWRVPKAAVPLRKT
jgi:hypothetical protein